jgi:alpha-1,2-mannosyltransferase
VYNYWEPLHYLVNGKGFQTWEYSPIYAIRSYFYLLIHTGPAVALKTFGLSDKASLFPKGLRRKMLTLGPLFAQRVSFFATRMMLGAFSSFVEAVFYRACAVHISSHVGRYVLWLEMFSAGLYSAATAFLPSSFAMYFVMLGTAASLSPVDGGWKRISFAVFAYAVAGIVGWPFAVLLGVPLVLEQLFVRGTRQKVAEGQTARWSMLRARNFGIALALGLTVAVRSSRQTLSLDQAQD